MLCPLLKPQAATTHALCMCYVRVLCACAMCVWCLAHLAHLSLGARHDTLQPCAQVVSQCGYLSVAGGSQKDWVKVALVALPFP